MCRLSKYMYIVDFHLLDCEANGLINNVTIRTFQHSMHFLLRPLLLREKKWFLEKCECTIIVIEIFDLQWSAFNKINASYFYNCS